MALIICRKCGNRVSTTAIKCPRCGTPPHTRNPTPQEIQAAHAPVQPVAKPRPAAPASLIDLDELARLIRSLRLDQLTPRQIVAGIGALVFAWWIFFSIPASPSYAIYNFYRNVGDHNGTAAAGFIDFETLTKSISEDAMNTAAEQKGTDPSAEVFARGLMGLMSGAIADTVKSRFKRGVEATSGKNQITMTFGDLVGVLWYLHRDGDSATSRVKDRDGNVIDVTFVRQADTGWRVSTVSGPGLQKLLQEQEKRRESGTGNNLSPPGKPGKDDESPEL